MKRSTISPVPFLLPLLVACTAPVPQPSARPSAAGEPLAAGAATITAADMYARIGVLADDSLRGRDTPSPGLESAAAYLVREYRRLGLEPAGENGTFYQRYPFPLRQPQAGAGRLEIASARGALSLRAGRDFFALGGTAADLRAPLVYVGREPEATVGDGGALRDRIAVAALPGSYTRDFRLERNRQAALARTAGAGAIIHLLDRSWTADSIARYAQRSAEPTRRLGAEPAFPELFLSYEAADRLFAAAGLRLGELWERGEITRAVPLPGVTAVAGLPQAELDRATAPNVVALLRGSDPALRDEYVVLSAHMDHVGVGEAVNGDSIYNGADDDASGTSGILEVAEAFASLPERPRRSVLFVHVSGEEKGLLGSEWFSDHPTVPLERIVADINVDMIGRNSPDTVVVIGKDYSSLGATVNGIQTAHPELGLVTADDIWPEERFFFRSDHFNFARKEVPAIFFFSGVHEDYHRPSDEVDRIDADKAARVARMVFYTAARIANADARPAWDPAGLEEVRSLTR